MSPVAAPVQRLLTSILTTVPSPNQVVLVSGYDSTLGTGTTVVRITVSPDTTTRAFACIVGVNDSPPDFPDTLALGMTPNGCTPLIDRANNSFDETFTISNLPATPPPSGNNRKLVVGTYRRTRFVEMTSRRFVAMPPTTTDSVRATACLWLTYAEEAFAGPFGESIGTADAPSVYVPFGISVPNNATKATLTVSGMWSHDPDPATLTSATGRTGTEQPLDPTYSAGYSNASTNNHHITSDSFALNRLVALWEYEDNPTIATAVHDAGIGGDLLVELSPTHTRPIRLRLGFHDGFEWSNNQRSVAVTITWSTT